MLNTNNTVNYEINVKQKYSWSTVFAWLYLKTIGRILPKKWNKWAENILSNQVTFQDTTMQTECVETTDKNIGADLKPEVAKKGSQSEMVSKDGEVQTEENSEFTDESCFDTIVNGEFIDEDYDSMEEVSIEEDEELNEQLSQELELERAQNDFLEEENRELRSKLAELEKNYKKLAEDAGKREEELVGVEEKDAKINSLMRLNEELDEELQETRGKIAEQEKLIEQLKKEQKQVESQLEADIKRLQEEKRDQLTEIDSLKKKLESLQSVALSTAKSTAGPCNPLKKPLQDKNLEHFLSDRNMDLKKDFPEFKEKNFLLNFLREIAKFLSNKQDGKFQGSELLNLFKTNLKESAREIVEDRVKEVVIDKGNKYYQVSKNIDKELLDGTMCKGKLKAKLLYSVKQCIKKLKLDEKDAITITDSIMDKICDKENSNKNPSALLKGEC